MAVADVVASSYMYLLAYRVVVSNIVIFKRICTIDYSAPRMYVHISLLIILTPLSWLLLIASAFPLSSSEVRVTLARNSLNKARATIRHLRTCTPEEESRGKAEAITNTY
jgi:hypothetical protein